MSSLSFDTQHMMQPLEAIGAANIDIVPRVFATFFSRFPEARDLFLNLEAAQGRMVNETIEALLGLSASAPWVESTVVNFVDLHRDYGDIPREHYDGFVDILLDEIARAASSSWTDASAEVWRRMAEALKAMIAKAADEELLF